MHDRRAKLIAELIKHLEDMDGEELKSGLPQPEPEPEAVMVAEVGEEAPEEVPNANPGEEEELEDEEFEELMKLSM